MNIKMDDALIFMINRFPVCRLEIMRAFETDDDFKSLCEDYLSASKTYDLFQQRQMNDYKGDLEYRELFLMLEKEVIHFLDQKRTVS